jgi:hypothetical protein
MKTLIKEFGFKKEDDLDSRAEKMLGKLFKDRNEDSRWSAIKNSKAEDIIAQKGKRSSNIELIKKLEKQFVSILGKDASPKENETVVRWIGRNINASLEQEKIYDIAA